MEIEFTKMEGLGNDFIIMDEQMPIMDGNEAVQEILKYEKRKGLRHTPVSALTANVIKGAKERGLSSGFDSFLGKPIVLKEFEKVLAKYLKIEANTDKNEFLTTKKSSKIEALDIKKLSEELMLSEEEIEKLLEMFFQKMAKLIPDMQDAIHKKDYLQIGFLSHSIKGVSGNFRMEFLQKVSDEMEKMAKEQNEKYSFRASLEKIKEKLEEISLR